MEAMMMEIYLQLGAQEAAELNLVLFILACEVWQFAIWGAPILSGCEVP